MRCCLQDADSLNKLGKKTEGAFYLWSEEEVDEALGSESAQLFKAHYYVKAAGNTDLSSRRCVCSPYLSNILVNLCCKCCDSAAGGNGAIMPGTCSIPRHARLDGVDGRHASGYKFSMHSMTLNQVGLGWNSPFAIVPVGVR